MNKITAAFDGLKYAESTKDFTLFLGRQADAHIVGTFVEARTTPAIKFTT